MMRVRNKPVLKLRLYRGTEINYDRDGVVKNENNLCSLEYGTKQWDIFMANLAVAGYCQVDVESGFLPDGKGGYNEINDLSQYEKEVHTHFAPRSEEVLENSELTALRAELDSLKALIAGKGLLPEEQEEQEEEEEVVEDDREMYKGQPLDQALHLLRIEYEEVYGKKPFNGWGAEKLEDKINEKKAELNSKE